MNLEFNPNRSLSTPLLGLAFTATLLGSTTAQAQVSIGGAQAPASASRTFHTGAIAVTGDDGELGPGLGPGVVFVAFQANNSLLANPSINDNGSTLFVATVDGPGITGANNTGIWAYKRGKLRVIAREGDAAPGQVAGVVFGRFGASRLGLPYHSMISKSGAVVFQAGLRGGDVTVYSGGGSPNDDAVVSHAGGSLQVIIREGVTPLPGFPGVVFGSPNAQPNDSEFFWGTPLMVTGAGKFAMRSRVNMNTGDNNWDVIVHNLNGALETFYRGGEFLPGLSPAKFWSTDWPYMSEGGTLVHRPSNTEASTAGFSVAFWSDRNGIYQPVLKQGDALIGGASLSGSPYLEGINSSGRIIFVDGQDPNGFDGAIWTEGLFGVPVKIAETLSAAPGTGGEAYSYLDLSTVLLSNNGSTVFLAPLQVSAAVNSTNDWGIWSNRSALTVELELREGDVAPGLSSAVFTAFRNIFTNGQGQIAAYAALDDNSQGLWIRDAATGQFDFRFKTFDLVNQYDLFGDGSDLRILTDIIVGQGDASGSTGNGRRTPFNDDGLFSVRLKFIDGSEAIVLDPGK